MTDLIRSEYRKFVSTQVWFWLFLLAIGLTALLVIVPLASDNAFDLHPRDIFLSPITAYIGSFVVGTLGVTTEFRYQTITPTLLATPSRWTLITAKLITYALVGAAYAVTCVVLTLLIAVPWLNGKGVDFSFNWDQVWGPLLSVSAAVVLFSLLGLGWGALVRNQVVAVAVGIIWIVIAESLIFSIPGIRVLRPYLPVGGVQAILSPHEQVVGNVHLLGGAGGMVVILVWALAFALGGAAISMNRDIT